MEITTYSHFRQNLKKFLDTLSGNHTPLFVKRSNGEDVVVLSKADYESMQETFYLMRSPQNALRLLEGLEEYKKGKGRQQDLIEESKLFSFPMDGMITCIGKPLTSRFFERSIN